MNPFHPSKIFLTDGIGALLTAILLGGVLAQFESIFGMPKSILYDLVIIVGIFSIYSLTCYFQKPKNWQFYLKIIAIANLLYCCITLGLVIFNFQKLTTLGILYFVIEILIIVALVVIEFKTARKG